MTRFSFGLIVFVSVCAACAAILWFLRWKKKLRVSRRLSLADVGALLAAVLAAAGLAAAVTPLYEPKASIEVSLLSGLKNTDASITLSPSAHNRWAFRVGKTHLYVVIENKGPGTIRHPVWILRVSPEPVVLACAQDMPAMLRPATLPFWCQFNDPNDIRPFADSERPYAVGFDITVPVGVTSGTLEIEIEGENLRTTERTVAFTVSEK